MDINELRDRIQALPALEKKMSALQKELNGARDEVSRLSHQYAQERGDVERLEKESLSSFLLKLVGKYEDKLEREQQEEITAKLAYDRAATQLEELTREQDLLKQRIYDLRADEKLYKTELNNRRLELSKLTGQDAERYEELENERKSIFTQMTEIREASSAASRAKSTALSALESLKSAQGWATYDVFTRGGIISHVAKYSHIDNAERNFNVLSSQLRALRKELGDVAGMTTNGLNEISSTQRAVDFWFDNIFTDLSVRGQIKNNAEEINRLLRGISSAESVLNRKQKEYEARLASNRRAEEELLVSLKT
ncbi:MAG: hypothetical protein FWH33_06980 [Oscillospiraceae bacterium]|nr:hypothetical protein [Oscillospiraceae bacterium]